MVNEREGNDADRFERTLKQIAGSPRDLDRLIENHKEEARS